MKNSKNTPMSIIDEIYGDGAKRESVDTKTVEADIMKIRSLMNEGDYAAAEEAISELESSLGVETAVDSSSRRALLELNGQLDRVRNLCADNDEMLIRMDKFISKLRELEDARREGQKETTLSELDRVTGNIELYK